MLRQCSPLRGHASGGLGGRASKAAWARLFKELKELLISAPSNLAELGAARLRIVSVHEEPNRLPGRLWGAVKAPGGAKAFSERWGPSAYICKGRGALRMAGAATADPAGRSEFGRAFATRAAEFGLTREECDSLGPRANLRKVAEGACSPDQIILCAQAGARLNLLKNCDDSLRSAAPGMRC